ncbi:MAG: hypothetical protein WC843_01740 [Candidatus Gracilibacteria bacterium]|jgi:hypothetical protein
MNRLSKYVAPAVLGFAVFTANDFKDAIAQYDHLPESIEMDGFGRIDMPSKKKTGEICQITYGEVLKALAEFGTDQNDILPIREVYVGAEDEEGDICNKYVDIQRYAGVKKGDPILVKAAAARDEEVVYTIDLDQIPESEAQLRKTYPYGKAPILDRDGTIVRWETFDSQKWESVYQGDKNVL